MDEFIQKNLNLEVNIGYTPPETEIKSEFGGQKLRFLQNSILKDSFTINLKESDKTEERCLDCEAMSHWNKLQGDASLSEIKEAVIWILENTEWPGGE